MKKEKKNRIYMIILILLLLIALAIPTASAVLPVSTTSTADTTVVTTSSGSSTATIASTTTGTVPTTPGQCVPQSFSYGTIANKLYDLVISTGNKKTSVLGIARQPIAVGIDKELTKLDDNVLCKPIPAARNMDQNVLKQLYGETQLNIESQLKEVSFLSKEGVIGSQGIKTVDVIAGWLKEDTKRIKVHRKIVPILQCVERELSKCDQAKSYSIDDIRGFDWTPDPNDPTKLTTSSFGIAIDINPYRNPSSETLKHDMPQCVIDAFKKFGFAWGGDYQKIKVPSHFEFLADPNLIVTMTADQMTLSDQTAPGTVPSATVDSPYSVAADSGDQFCWYCKDMRDELKKLYPGETPDCSHWTGCCKSKCPPGSYINPKAKYFAQGDPSFKSLPSNCGNSPKHTVSRIGCSSTSWKMALTMYDIDKSHVDVFCPTSSLTVFPGFGSNMKKAVSNAGLVFNPIPENWQAVANEAKQGHPIMFSIYDYAADTANVKIKARFGSGSKQHFVVAIGGNDNYLIINDPGGTGGKASEHTVISKAWFEQSAKYSATSSKTNPFFYGVLPSGSSTKTTV